MDICRMQITAAPSTACVDNDAAAVNNRVVISGDVDDDHHVLSVGLLTGVI